MQPDEAKDFVRWVISELATRPPVRGRKNSSPLVGKHAARTIESGSFRVSDLSEREYVCFVALREAGYSSKGAAGELEEVLGDRVAQSNRGRPRVNSSPRDMIDRLRNVQAMVSEFGRRVRSQLGDAELERRVDFYIRAFQELRKAGIVIGSEFVPDAAQQMILAHQRRLNVFFRRSNRKRS